ncbi:hypothetical protein pb186bvf_002011 [Paramecium bursaria]
MNDWLKELDDVGPWEENLYKPVKPVSPQSQPRRMTAQTSQTGWIKQLNRIIRNTDSDVKSVYRSRVRSIDSKLTLKCTPVKQFCDFKVSREFMMTKNSTLFPKQSLPKNYLQQQRKKITTQPVKKSSSMELNSALAITIQKIEEQVKSRSSMLAAKRLSNPKYQQINPFLTHHF